MASKQDVFGYIGKRMQQREPARSWGESSVSIAALIQRIDHAVDLRRNAGR